MKRIVKWLIPCLVACFMVVGLVQTASFTFAIEEGQTEETNEVLDENSVLDDENTTGDSGEGESEDEPSGQKRNTYGSGDDHQTITLVVGETYNLGYSIKAYSSNNESVATVSYSKGKYSVTAVSVGTTYIKQGRAIKYKIVVGYVTNAGFYYLKSPNYDPHDNDTASWSDYIGYGQVNVENATWSPSYKYSNGVPLYDQSGNLIVDAPDKNIYDDVTHDVATRVQTWPGSNGSIGNVSNGKLVVNPGNNVWNDIFESFKAEIAQQVGIPETDVTADMVNEIRLVPFKISRNNATDGNNPYGYHVDCKVEIISDFLNARYYVQYPNSQEFTLKEGYYYQKDQNGKSLTSPKNTYGNLPLGGNKIYRFEGWYLDRELTQKVSFPYEISENTDFYARYVEITLADEDQNYIKIEKTFTGITNINDIPENFKITIQSTADPSSVVEITKSDVKQLETEEGEPPVFIISKSVPVKEGTYNIIESDAYIGEHKLEVSVNDGEPQVLTSNGNVNVNGISVKESGIELTNIVQDPTKDDNTYPLKIDGDNAEIFIALINGDSPYAAVFSKEILSQSHKQKIEAQINQFKGWNIDETRFYSINGQSAQTFKLETGNVTFENNEVKLESTKGNSMYIKSATAKYSVSKAENPDISISNTYTSYPKLTVKKQVTGAFGDKTASFDIKIMLQQGDSNFEGTVFDESGNSITFVNGEATISLKDNESSTLTLPFGTKYKVKESSESSAGYSVSYSIDSEDAAFEKYVALNDNDEVVVTNERKAAPITGIIDNTPKGLGLIGSIVVEIAAIAFVLKKKRQLKM